jgi:hypothetical protein
MLAQEITHMSKKQQFLHVVAVENANVREVEPNGAVLTDIRFIGKQFNSNTKEFLVLPEGVVLPYSARLVAQLKLGTLIAGDQETARLAGVKFIEG